jgi:hypothetical protein
LYGGAGLPYFVQEKGTGGGGFEKPGFILNRSCKRALNMAE